ncbi:Ferritin [Aphelenchoides besseyi]|nr:Ferritin [Aphelenchoides besseyi]
MAEPFKAKQNFSSEVQDGINNQINCELSASYLYLAMSNYCRRTSVAMPGAGAFFLKQSYEEREHAQKLIDYMIARGGKVDLQPLERPMRQKWKNMLQLFHHSLDLERANNYALLELHKVASKQGDPDVSCERAVPTTCFQFTNFLEEFYLRNQVKEIHDMAVKCIELERIGDNGTGIHIYDNELAKAAKED